MRYTRSVTYRTVFRRLSLLMTCRVFMSSGLVVFQLLRMLEHHIIMKPSSVCNHKFSYSNSAHTTYSAWKKFENIKQNKMTNDEIHMIPTLKTKRTTHKADDGLRINITCFTRSIPRVTNQVIIHEWEKNWIVIMANGIYIAVTVVICDTDIP